MSHILIIDDDDALRIVLKASLEQMGHTVVESTDGRNGVECYKGEAFDVVITDLIMPDKEGIETILDLRKINPDVKIIAMSGGGRVGPGDYLEDGNVRNAVNFPDTRMAREGSCRLCIANRNRPNMIGQLSQVLGEAGINIHQMHNASRGDLAYTLVDADSPLDDAALGALRAIAGILSVRVV